MTESNIPVNVFVAPATPTVTWNAEAPPETTTAQEGELLTSDRVAILLGITTNNLRQLVFKKKLVPVAKDGRKNLFAREDVDQLMQVYIQRQVRKGAQ